MTKICQRCKKEKELDEFGLLKGRVRSWCRKCTSEYVKNRYNTNQQARDNQRDSVNSYKKKIRDKKKDLICPICNRLTESPNDLEEHLAQHRYREGKSQYALYRAGTLSLKEYTEKKNNFLGVPISKAQYELKRRIIFMLIVESGRIKCYRCGKDLSVDDYSVEHKKDWLWKDPDLFWDLDNISFSHKKCNIQGKK